VNQESTGSVVTGITFQDGRSCSLCFRETNSGAAIQQAESGFPCFSKIIPAILRD